MYIYIYIIISYNFDAMTFAERTYVHTYSVVPLPPAPVPKNFLPRLRGKARPKVNPERSVGKPPESLGQKKWENRLTG